MGNARQTYGLFAAVCDDHCVLIIGDRGDRLGAKVRKRSGVKMATLLPGGDLYPVGSLVKPAESAWVNAQICTFRRGPYNQDRGPSECHVGACYRNGASLTIRGHFAKRFPVQIGEALTSISAPVRATPHPRVSLASNVSSLHSSQGINAQTGPISIGDPDPPSHPVSRKPSHAISDGHGPVYQPTSRRPSKARFESGRLPGLSIVFGSLGKLECFRSGRRNREVSQTARRAVTLPGDNNPDHAVTRPSLSKLGSGMSVRGSVQKSHTPTPSLYVKTSCSLAHPGVAHDSSHPHRVGQIDVRTLTPAGVKRPRGCIQPDTAPSETPAENRLPAQSDPTELTLGRMGNWLTRPHI